MAPVERLRGVDISRRLCSRSLATRLPPGRTPTDIVTPERFALIQSWGFSCSYLQRLPKFDDPASSRCCTFCQACGTAAAAEKRGRTHTAARGL